MNRQAFLGGLTVIAGFSAPFDQSAADTNDEISVDDTDPSGDNYRLDIAQTANKYETVDSYRRTLIVGPSALKTPVDNC